MYKNADVALYHKKNIGFKILVVEEVMLTITRFSKLQEVMSCSVNKIIKCVYIITHNSSI